MYQPQITEPAEVAAQILSLLEEIKFGSVEITIHDGKVTLIERKEKIKPSAD
ncbi:MAG: YezD family protein [Methylococcales bacterium]